MYIGWPKKFGTIFVHLNIININQFTNYFTDRIKRKLVIIPSLKIPSHLKCQFATLPCEMSILLKANWKKPTSLTTHFKKLVTGNNPLVFHLLFKLIATSSNFYIKCSLCPNCCWTTYSSLQCHWPMVWSMKCCTVCLTYWHFTR